MAFYLLIALLKLLLGLASIIVLLFSIYIFCKIFIKIPNLFQKVILTYFTISIIGIGLAWIYGSEIQIQIRELNDFEGYFDTITQYNVLESSIDLLVDIGRFALELFLLIYLRRNYLIQKQT